MPPEHVLVPLDGSPLAEEALEEALSTFDARITVLNVVTPLDDHMSEGGVVEPGDDRLEAARERAERLAEHAVERASAMDRTIETVVDTDDPADAILDFVEAHDVDHVVMGSHGEERNAFVRRLLGTVATKVVGEAPVTVTVVR
jgi:nucleotide-binding universal stress UspA family protein